MNTAFTDAEDKLLVQIAYKFEKEGLRITWRYVARRTKTKRPSNELPCASSERIGFAKKLPTLYFHWTPNESYSPKTGDTQKHHLIDPICRSDCNGVCCSTLSTLKSNKPYTAGNDIFRWVW
ncbi:hypothetical protein JG687_00015313 [Phytophthora cactorum]|uniref:Homeodomain-like n=1 Tax=Phytophthora cactorum TaxID=29920 RepID=A0A8T1TWA5_9STRA|nr:hypothetical protein JG687_00015313 [Phytophthora cactorum]